MWRVFLISSCALLLVPVFLPLILISAVLDHPVLVFAASAASILSTLFSGSERGSPSSPAIAAAAVSVMQHTRLATAASEEDSRGAAAAAAHVALVEKARRERAEAARAVQNALRARGEALGVRADVGLAQRAERAAVLIVGLLAGGLLSATWLTAALALISVASAITVVQRIRFVRAGLAAASTQAPRK